MKAKAAVPLSIKAMHEASTSCGLHAVLSGKLLPTGTSSQAREGLTVAALELQEGLKQVFRNKHSSAEPPEVAVVFDAEFPDHCSPYLQLLPGDLLSDILSALDIPDVFSCLTVSRSWSDPSSLMGSVLLGDQVWRRLCKQHWATKADRFRVDMPDQEAALVAAHPGSSWKRLYHLAEVDGQRCELTPFERKNLRWMPYLSDMKHLAPLRISQQIVTFTSAAPRPRGALVGSGYRVVRLGSWEWLLVGQRNAFISTQQRQTLARIGERLEAGHSDFESWLSNWLSSGGEPAEMVVISGQQR
jgi:hypothetical protein